MGFNLFHHDQLLVFRLVHVFTELLKHLILASAMLWQFCKSQFHSVLVRSNFVMAFDFEQILAFESHNVRMVLNFEEHRQGDVVVLVNSWQLIYLKSKLLIFLTANRVPQFKCDVREPLVEGLPHFGQKGFVPLDRLVVAIQRHHLPFVNLGHFVKIIRPQILERRRDPLTFNWLTWHHHKR